VALTYAEVGATREDTGLPAGYRHVRRRRRVGAGRAAFDALAAGMRAFQVHRGAGMAVRAEGPATVGRVFTSGLGIGPFRLWAPCQIVWLADEPDRYAYGFGTLRGHPMSGEEAMLASLEADGSVWFAIRAFSRPVAWYARVGGPLRSVAQDRVTDRYVAAAGRLAAT
jgi:uncharacterized protein (UPF0548 family)